MSLKTHPVNTHFFAMVMAAGITMLLLASANNVYGQAGPEITNMLNQLSQVERSDAVFPEHSLLISNLFSQKKTDTDASLQLTCFLLSAAPPAGKRYLVNEIAATGTPRAVGFLTRLLGMETTASLALQTLSGMPLTQVDEALIRAFGGASPSIQAGILTCLGERGGKKSVGFLSRHIHSGNDLVAGAAIAALGRTGDQKAASVLLKEYRKGGHPAQESIAGALLECAGLMHARADSQSASAIYNEVNNSTTNEIQKTAAIRGMMLSSPGQAVDILKTSLQNASPSLKPAIARLAGQLPDAYNSGSELLLIPGLTDDIKLRLITIRAQNADHSVRASALAFLNHPEAFYRESALQALSLISGPDDVLVFAGHAAEGTGNEKDLSRLALYRIPGKASDEIILQQANSQNEKTSAELIRAIAERNILTGTDVLLEAAAGPYALARMEAYRSLAFTANREYLESIMQLLAKTENSRERQELERTLAVIALADPPAGGANEEILRFMESASQLRDKISMLAVLGNVRNTADLSGILPYLNNGTSDLKLAALRALSDWPDSSPVNALREVVTGSDDIRLKTLALRAHTQVINNDASLTAEAKANMMAFGLEQAGGPGEKRLVIAALGRIPSTASLTLLSGQLPTETELKPELEAAIISIGKTLLESDPDKTRELMKDALRYTQNEEIIRMSGIPSDND